MSEKLNPVKALDAIISPDIIVELDSGEKVSIKPISISTLAVLDSIGSPILNNENANMLNMISTIYICMNGYKAAFTDKSILEEALEYFDKLSLTNSDFEKLRVAIMAQFAKILKIQPELSSKKKLKQTVIQGKDS
jgi:hypothetical protein